MVEMEFSEHRNRKQIRQPGSVPFLWEEKPGTPKKDWKPEAFPVNIVPPPPLKLVPSVPFKWEEKPGKPLPCFSQALPPESLLPLPGVKPVDFPSPPVYSQGYDDDADGSSGGDGDDDNDDNDEQDRMFELDQEAFVFETDESFSSAPSLLANRLLSTVAISTAVPVQKTFLMENNSSHPETPSSPVSKTESSSSSYATGTTSPVGASFLECLFPLFSPESSFLEKVGCSEKGSSLTPPAEQSKGFDCESNCSIVVRRTPTLGELIQMSRRRSYRRKATQMRKQSLSMEFMKKRAFGCCIFGTWSNRIGRLAGKRNTWPRLKLT